MSKYITQSKFIRYLKHTPYFIWNDISNIIDKKGNIIEDEDGEYGQDGDVFEWLKLDEEAEFEILNEGNTKFYSLKDVKVVKLVEKFTHDFFACKKANSSVHFVTAKKIENAIQETKEAIALNIDWIINPVLEYKGALAFPKAINLKEKQLILQKYSSSSKRIDWYKSWWDYNIAKYSVEIVQISLMLLSKLGARKGELNFKIIDEPDISKSPSKKKLPNITTLANVIIEGKINNDSDLKNAKKLNEIYRRLVNLNIDKVIVNIEEAREIGEYKHNLNSELLSDNHEIGNDHLQLLRKYHKDPYAHISGHLIDKKHQMDIHIAKKLERLNEPIIKAIINNEGVLDRKAIEKIITPLSENKNRVIWYDFEGFSLPTSTLDYYPPFRQTVFQVSIVETKLVNNIHEDRNVINKIYDPQTLCGDNFADIINSIYSLQADAYVVYNKLYENTRLDEMVNWLLRNDHPYAHQEAVKVEWIKKRTVDLLELFVVTKNASNFPPILIPELGGKYSIKFIEKFITKHKIKLPFEITPYESLDIQNGMMAMDIAIERALGAIGDLQWSEQKNHLKKYCENDVRSMIMVYYFAKKVLENSSIINSK